MQDLAGCGFLGLEDGGEAEIRVQVGYRVDYLTSKCYCHCCGQLLHSIEAIVRYCGWFSLTIAKTEAPLTASAP
jgi:hypothetical protein